MGRRFAIVLVLMVAGFSALVDTTVASNNRPKRDSLDIDPVFQQTPVWCWAAVGEMVFRYYGVANINPAGNFQCGITALLHPACNQNCGNCVVPAGSLSTMNNMLTQYPSFAAGVSGVRTRVSTRTQLTPLSQSALEAEIDAERPVVAGISPSGYRTNVSQHVALIIGYDDDDLIVNDPFPFGAATFTGNPYLASGGIQVQRGQYQIDYSAFVKGLRWRESIYRISCAGADCAVGNTGGGGSPQPQPQPQAQLGRSCQTPYGTCGPFYNQPALPIGSACYCPGPVYGRVVR